MVKDQHPPSFFAHLKFGMFIGKSQLLEYVPDFQSKNVWTSTWSRLFPLPLSIHRSDTAILYNDRSVLENHHISAIFRMMQDEEMNILVNLTKDEFVWDLILLSIDLPHHMDEANSS